MTLHPSRSRIPRGLGRGFIAALGLALGLLSPAGDAARAEAQTTGRSAILQGRLLERESGRPVSGARVILGDSASARTDRDGRFELAVAESGETALRIERPDGGRDSASIQLLVGRNVVEIAVQTRAVALRGIEVKVVPQRAREDRRRTTSQYLMDEVEVGTFARRGVRMVDVLQSKFPVRLREQPGTSGVCVEGRRGAPTVYYKNVRPSTGAGCDMLDVFLDGVRLGDPGMVLRTMSLDDVESIELLSPIASSWKAGAFPSSGVLLIELKRGLARNEAQR